MLRLPTNGFCVSVVAAFLMQSVSSVKAGGAGYGMEWNFGSSISSEDVAAYGPAAVDSLGRGLPPGRGTYKEGKIVFNDNCASCHGSNMQGVKDLPDMPSGRNLALIGGRGTLNSEKPTSTVESFWPYATTLFDYVRRAMPYHSPGSLNDKQVYSVVAYILSEANIIDENTEMNSESLPKVKMPNADGFIHEDTRLEVFK